VKNIAAYNVWRHLIGKKLFGVFEI
jgi:hypothetical protein